MTAPEPINLQNRIIETGMKPADQFQVNPLNHRKHPMKQRRAVEASLRSIGWIQGVIENKRTGHLIDGHERVWQALRSNQDVPYVLVDLSEEEEKLALAVFDKITTMAEVDADIVEQLLQDVQTDEQALAETIAELANESGLDFEVNNKQEEDLFEINPFKEEYMIPMVERPDAVFLSTNDYGIPDLQMFTQATFYEPPVVRWGRFKRHNNSDYASIIHFYTEDYKFNAIWTDPTPIISSGCKAIIEPNVSLCKEHPLAFALWATYKKRWISSYVSHYGVKVFVDLNVPQEFDEINLIGVPKGWNAYASRHYSEFGVAELEKQYRLACDHAGVDDVLFLVSGGGKNVKEFCIQNRWHHIDLITEV